MTIKNRILSAMTAAAMIASAAPAVMPVTVSAESAILYDDDDFVPYSMFKTGSSDEAQLALEEVFEKATKKTLDLITFGDLAGITSLNLSGLGLEGVPEAIEYMVRLRSLNLSRNLLRNGDVINLDLSGCISLTSVDISNNYLTTVPAWFVSLDIPTKKITDNLINTSNQRSITSDIQVYYFMNDDIVNENALKNKILASVKLSDGTKLPTFFFDPQYLPYNEDDIDDPAIKDGPEYDHALTINDWDISKYVGRDHKVSVTKAQNVDVSVMLYSGSGSSSNPNTNLKIKLYFLDGNDPTSIKVRLDTLISECSKYSKGEYTATSWTNFEAALKTATTIYNYEAADVDMMKDALEGLELAKSNLVKGISSSTKKVLNDLISIAGTFKEADYTVASWIAFTDAVNRMKEIVANPDASIIEANAAIKAYQDAQAGLISTSLAIPDTAPKSDFEAIYGEDKNVSYSGVTREGFKYTWTFNGKDITEPMDLKPEIKYESAYEELIRFEVGTASDYQLISFAHAGKFPGKATITLDVSAKYKNGIFRLYKWNTSTKKSELYSDVIVKDGIATITVEEGGDYFISSVLQNFQMISSNFEIDHNKLTISNSFKKKYTVAGFRNSLENGEAVKILNADGTPVLDTDYLATGMTAAAPNSDVAYTIIVPGDIDGDGNVTALDAVAILRAVIGETTLETYAQKAAGDVNGDGWVRADDAVLILKYTIGIE